MVGVHSHSTATVQPMATVRKRPTARKIKKRKQKQIERSRELTKKETPTWSQQLQFLFTLKFWMIFSTILIFVEVALLWGFPPEAQKMFCEWTDILQTKFGNDPLLIFLSRDFHRRISSNMWFGICNVLFWFSDNYDPTIYIYVTLGFILKNLGKGLIQNPRSFWLCEINCHHCGSGFSLPSGHAMMSSLVFMFVIYHTISKNKQILLCILFLAYEALLSVNVVYLGTHTIIDLVLGWTVAVWWFSVFLLAKQHFYPNTDKNKPSTLRSNFSSRELKILIFLVTVVFVMELVEYMYNETWQVFLPKEWKDNLVTSCSNVVDWDATKQHMKTDTSLTKTASLIGIIISNYLRGRFVPITRKKSIWHGVVAVTVGLLLSHYFSNTLLTVLGYFFYLLDAENKHFFDEFCLDYAEFVLPPIWIIFVAPWIFHKLGLYTATRLSTLNRLRRSLRSLTSKTRITTTENFTSNAQSIATKALTLTNSPPTPRRPETPSG